jgi:hypothetical protein
MGWAGIVAPIGNLKHIYKVTGKKKPWREVGLEDLGVDGILKRILNEFGPLAGSYEHGNEFSVTKRDREMYDQLRGQIAFQERLYYKGLDRYMYQMPYLRVSVSFSSWRWLNKEKQYWS